MLDKLFSKAKDFIILNIPITYLNIEEKYALTSFFNKKIQIDERFVSKYEILLNDLLDGIVGTRFTDKDLTTYLKMVIGTDDIILEKSENIIADYLVDISITKYFGHITLFYLKSPMNDLWYITEFDVVME